MKYQVDVLVIDDEQLVRELLNDCLEEHQVSVAEAADGRQGLAKILELRPRVVVSDVRMPELNGYQVLHELRKNHPELAATRFMLLTGLSDAEYVSAAYKIGVDDYITKPIDTQRFLDRVLVLLEASRADEARNEHLARHQAAMPWTDILPRELTLSTIADAVGGKIKNLPFNVGQVICIGVEDVRERLGERRWEKTRDRLTELIIGAAKRHCGPNDTYFRCPDGSVLIVFSEKDVGRARETAAKIAKRVNNSLFGAEDCDGVTVDCRVDTAGAGAARKVSSPGDIVEALMPFASRMGIMEAARSGQGEHEERSSDGSDHPAPPGAVARKEETYEDLRGQLLEKFSAFGTQPIKFRYSPVLNLQKKFVGMFECLPSRRSGKANVTHWNYDVLPRGHEISDIVALDVACLEQALLGVTDQLIAGKPVLVCPTVHYETLAGRQGRDRILELLNQMPGELSDSLSLKVMFVPEGVPEIRLSEILGQVRGRVLDLSVEVSVHVDGSSVPRMINRFRAGGFRNIFVRMSPDTPPHDIEKAKTIAAGAKKAGMVAGMLGVESRQLLMELAYSGFVLFGGTILGSPGAVLPAPYPFDATTLEAEG